MSDRHHGTSSVEEGKMTKKGDVKSHKFSIKKAFTCGNYFIILNSNRTVTVRKEWEIQQSFTDIEDIVLYGQSSLQLKGDKQEEKNWLNQEEKTIKFKFNKCDHSSIFILNRIKENINHETRSEIIVLAIREGQKENGEIQNQREKVEGKTQCKVVKLKNQKQIGELKEVQLSQNGLWATSSHIIYSIQITQAQNESSQTKNFYDTLKIEIKSLSLNAINEAVKQKVSSILLFKRLSENTWFMGYFSEEGFMCNCKFRQAGSSIDLISFNRGQKFVQNMQDLFLLKSTYFFKNEYSSSKWQNLMFILDSNWFMIYGLNSLKLISQVRISEILGQEFSSNSVIALCQNNNVWIFDRSNISLHKINIKAVIQQHIIKPMNDLLNAESEQLAKGHSNTTKLLHLRLKILKLHSAYLEGKIEQSSTQKQFSRSIKHADYSSCLRLLNKEENISLLNDGITYMVKFILSKSLTSKQLSNTLPANLSLKQLEQSLVKLLNKLILSKYESHVENGLDLLIKIFTFFNTHSQTKDSSIQTLYLKIGESSRVQKLLQQEKKKKLWELAYIFTLKLQNFTHNKP